jgi:hypothetical protein
MKWPVGTELWMVQIRYWEEAENPIPVRVTEVLSETDQRHLKVYHSEYNHEAYIPEERCFCSRDNAIKIAKLLTELREIKLDDEVDFLITRLIEETSSIPPEQRQFADRALELAPVSKAGNVYNGYLVVHALKPHVRNQIGSTIYWDSYSAQQAAKKLERDHSTLKLELLEVKVTEIKSKNEI